MPPVAQACGRLPLQDPAPVVLGAVAVTFVVLIRAFRSLLLPLKAVLLNLLTVAAVYGLLVAVFQWGRGEEVEGWVPIFLFAVLFGLSMDYEVFLVMRMREAWGELHDTAAAVAYGLERTGRIVTGRQCSRVNTERTMTPGTPRVKEAATWHCTQSSSARSNRGRSTWCSSRM